jgi:uncharacterized protein YjcR
MDMESSERSPREELLRGDEMRTPDEVAAMLRLRSLGWGTKRIAAELGCSRNTVKRYIEAQGWLACRCSLGDDALQSKFARSREEGSAVGFHRFNLHEG